MVIRLNAVIHLIFLGWRAQGLCLYLLKRIFLIGQLYTLCLIFQVFQPLFCFLIKKLHGTTHKQIRHLNLIKQKILKTYSTKYIFTNGISVYSNNSIWVKNKYPSFSQW